MLDRKLEIYITAGSVIILMMRDSPFEVHRRAFHEGVEERGGYFESTVMPPDLIQTIRDGKSVGIAPQDSMAPYQHFARPGKDVLTTGYTGFYYPNKQPLKKELDKGLQALYEAGITEEVTLLYLIITFPSVRMKLVLHSSETSMSGSWQPTTGSR